MVIGLIGIIYLIAYLITVVHFCKWVHRANTNVRGFGAQGLQFTPEWAAGWYFIPFLNLVRPYQAMQEIWKASQSPARWATESAPGLLGVWWGLYLVSNIVNNLSARMSLNAGGVSELQSAAIADAVSSALNIAAAIAAITVVQKIVQLQCDYVASRS